MSLAQAANPALILASASPRRRELLQQLGVQFTVGPADIDEAVLPAEEPQLYVERMALEKARAGYQRAIAAGADSSVVLGADTAVVVAGTILGKPVDQQDAARMLGMLSGGTHQVLSAVAMTDGQRLSARTSTTDVSFRALQSTEIATYWATGEPVDKAGAYAIQGLGALFVRAMSGSYTGVVGLPLFETAELLTEFGCRTTLDSA